MAWAIVVAAGLFEVAMAVTLKLSDGWSRLWPTVGFAFFGAVSFLLLALALKRLEVGPAYAVWTGIGAAGTAIVGMAFLREQVSAGRIGAIALILAGVVMLNLSGAGH